MNERTVDVVVVGAGPAGENAAGRAAENGLQVAIVEAQLVGGECSYWACIPSKVLLRPGEVLAAARRVPGAAAAVRGEVDAAAVFAWRDEMVASFDDAGQLPWLEERGIALVRGQGRLDGEKAVRVARPDGSSETLRARRAVVLATGTAPALPPVDGLADVGAWDNRSATATSRLPRRLLVIGGGPVGAELAQAFRRLGSAEVTLVESGPRLLGQEEPFAAEEVRAGLAADGVRVRTGRSVARVSRTARDGAVAGVLDDGTELAVDDVLVATGRRPRTDDVGLETVGLPPGEYVEVDDTLRATGVAGEWLYAVGDVNGLAPLTHLGKYQGRIVGDVLAGRAAWDRASADVVPRVTFTDPQVAAVGLTEAEARSRFAHVHAVRHAVGEVAGGSLLGAGVSGTCALVVDEDRQVVVGATFTGPPAAELLHSATIAIAGEVPLDRLWHAVPAFPTVSEVWLRLLEQLGL